jgi:hypothetical protein
MVACVTVVVAIPALCVGETTLKLVRLTPHAEGKLVEMSTVVLGGKSTLLPGMLPRQDVFQQRPAHLPIYSEDALLYSEIELPLQSHMAAPTA